jgi:glucose-6-phosphate isomerase
MTLDFLSGKFDDGEPTAVRSVQDLCEIWQTQPAPDDNRVVYRTFGMSAGDRDQPDLLYASTVIEPGEVHGEFFMTRGHFHVKPERGEWMLTLRGEGALLLRDRAGKSWSAPLRAGTVSVIEGQHAHRVVNTGSNPLVFVVTWLADCGHDYETIRREGFGMRVLPDTQNVNHLSGGRVHDDVNAVEI